MLNSAVLGPLEVWRDGRSVDVRGEKRRALLAILVLHANEVVRRERLLEELWGENPPATATASSTTRSRGSGGELGAEVVVTRPSAMSCGQMPRRSTSTAFSGSCRARPLPVGERAGAARGGACALARLTVDRPRRRAGTRSRDPAARRSQVDVLEQRINADLELGRSGELVAELEALVAEHPMRERLRGQLILALYRAGRQAEALETYRETRRVLSEELGIEPSQELRELERAILRQDPALEERHVPEPQPAAPRSSPSRLAAHGESAWSALRCSSACSQPRAPGRR